MAAIGWVWLKRSSSGQFLRARTVDHPPLLSVATQSDQVSLNRLSVASHWSWSCGR